MIGRVNLIAWCCVATMLSAAPARGAETEHAYRMLGLFQEDRQDDLGEVIDQLDGIELVAVDHRTGRVRFRYDQEALFPNKTAEQVVQQLDRLIRSGSRGTFRVTEVPDTRRSELKRVEIEIVGLDCRGCSYAAYLAIYEIEGVDNAIASFKAGKVVAWIDPDKTDRETLEKALTDEGVKLKQPESE